MGTAALRRRSRRLAAALPVSLLLALSGAGAPGAAMAAPGKRVGVHLRGREAGPVRQQIVEALERHGIGALPAGQLESAAHALHVGLDSDAHCAAVARRLKLGALVVGDVHDGGGRAQIKVHGPDGNVIADGAWSVPGGVHKLADAVGRSVWSRIGGALEDPRGAGASKHKPAVAAPAVAPPPPRPAVAARPVPVPVVAAAPPPAEKPPEAPEQAAPAAHEGAVAESVASAPATGAAGGGGAPPALEAAIGPRLVSRDLSWVKDIDGAMRPFSLAREPALGLLIAWHPAAHMLTGWPTYLGVVVSGEYAPGVTVGAADGNAYPTSASDYWAGARVRVPFGQLDGALTLGYGQHAFLIRSGATSNRANLAVPDVKYSYLRIGADARLRLPADFALLAGVGYRDVLSAGTEGYQAQSPLYFQRATLTALDLTAALGYRFSSMMEARLGFDLRRYGFDMHPRSDDLVIVSGAIDQYVAFWAHIAVLLDGAAARAP